MNKLGNLFVIAAASGTGKTSLVRALVGVLNQLTISVSYTTRQPRPNEINGQDYFFINKAEFEEMLAKNLFLEHALIYGHYYGTSKEWVVKQLENNIDIILEIDWQGAKQIRAQIPESVLIFILPPSLPALFQRLQHRKQDKAAVISRRMAGSQEEISHYQEFEYLIINESFEKALADLQHIICSARLTLARQEHAQATLLQKLLKK